MSGWKFEIVFNYILFEAIEKLVINSKVSPVSSWFQLVFGRVNHLFGLEKKKTLNDGWRDTSWNGFFTN